MINDRYRIDSELGQGGMGTVYKGFDTVLKREIAIKMMTESRLGTEGRSRLLQEAQAIAQLSHPNIITIFDVGEQQESPFIVMEYVEGINLYQQPPKEIEAIVGIIQQVCAALVHAHENGIIHRDLKPENVIIAPTNTVKLMDFGLARSISSRLTSEGTILGTVYYLAPELAQGQAVDQRSDLYSLGVMLYELTTGELPFVDDDPLAVISQHIHAPVVPPGAKKDKIPPALEALILKLMEKDPSYRPASAKEVLDQLSGPEMLDVEALPAEELSMLDRIVHGRLVGREQELRQARQTWGQAVGGAGQLLLISGEPGVGKTRLMREVVTLAEISSGRALIGGSYAEGDPPYAPFRHILSDAIRVSKEAGLAIPEEVLIDLHKIAPELRTNLPDLPEKQSEDPQPEQQRFLDQILFLFNMLTNHTPILLVLEDAHWSDNSTLMLIRHLARSTRSQRLMILVTYREVELDDARSLHETLMDFNREKLGTRIKLTRLNRQEAHEMLTVLFAEEITQEFLEGIYRETEGNPFFIEEVCKAIVESGKMTYQDGRWKRPSMEELGVPQSIQVAIQSRLRVLSEAAQKALVQAAILGREFDFELLLSAMESEENSLLDALDEALHAKLVEEMGKDKGGRFAFIHALIPTSIAAGLRTLQRRRLHKQAAQAIESLHPDAFEVLAHQFIEAGETDKGVTYLIQAGDRARGVFAHQEAINSYQLALDHLREEGETIQAAKALMKLGHTYHNDFRFPEARQAYEEGFNLWQQSGKQEGDEDLPPAPHAFRGLLQEPTSIDPLTDDGWAAHIVDNIFSGLVALNSDWEIVPEVAQRWEVLDNGLRYLFHLRDDVTWSDGVPVTAHDFEFAWKRALDPANESRKADEFYAIKHAKAFHQGYLEDPDAVGVYSRDNFTLEVELERPFGALLYVLSSHASYPVPRHIVHKYEEAWTDLDFLVTNGPFKLASWEPGTSMSLEANPTYKGRFPGNLQQVEMLLYTDRQTVKDMNLYQDDRIDFLWIGLSANPKRARSQYPEEFRTAPFLRTDHIGFNTKKPPFDDPRVRKALALAIDREHLINTIYGGIGFIPATGGLLPPGMPGYSEGIALPYDPAQARRLLAEAGHPDGRGFPVIEAYKSSDPILREKIQNQWKENLGIEIRWRAIPWKEFVELQNHQNLHIWTLGNFADYPDPDAFLRSAILERTGWSHDEFNDLLDRAAEMMDYTERLEFYQRAERILIDEVPVLPISHARFDVLVKPWVRRFPLSPSRGWYWKEIILEPH
jgi:ABC-type oligopeptide transport system substrate-binding subunit/serine/threonine protein kinase